jgi:hypothetical protein
VVAGFIHLGGSWPRQPHVQLGAKARLNRSAPTCQLCTGA